MLGRNFIISVIPIIIKSKVYRAKVFSMTFLIHALGEAFFLPWMSLLNTLVEIACSVLVIAISFTGLAITPTATTSEKAGLKTSP